MTAQRCCPACGKELPAHGGTSCGCMGPFAAEHVDPMHIRPYVNLPAAGQSYYGAEPLAGNGAPAAGYATPPPAGTGAADAGPLVPDPEPSTQHRTGETAEPPAPASSVPSRRHRSSHAAPRAVKQGRRHKGTVVLAAASVFAIGTGLLTTQWLTDDQPSFSSEDRALPKTPSGQPTDEPSSNGPKERKKKPSSSPSRTASPTPSKDRGGSEGDTPSAPDTPDDGKDRPTQKPQPGSGTLRLGDKGSAVADLQRRLKKTGNLNENVKVDGVYSVEVQMAVMQYQFTNNASGDIPGEYGPKTRKALESQT